MDNVNKTLYIPLYGKALVSRKGLLLKDNMAEKIWAEEGFPLKGKSKSKWLAYYMGMRAAVFDRWVSRCLEEEPAAAVLHLGCGLDSRCERVTGAAGGWYDVDFPDVIRERQRYFCETERYHMVSADIRDVQWLDRLPGGKAVVVLEGVSMYLRREELRQVLEAIRKHFTEARVLMDCYTELAARASKVRNPINDVGVTQVYGLDDPKEAEVNGLRFCRELSMTPEDMIDTLPGLEKKIFRTLYAGGIAKRMYRLYEYTSGGNAR